MKALYMQVTAWPLSVFLFDDRLWVGALSTSAIRSQTKIRADRPSPQRRVTNTYWGETASPPVCRPTDRWTGVRAVHGQDIGYRLVLL